VNWWPLLGVALVVAGFAARINPVLVVVAAGFATGLLAGIAPLELLTLLGESLLKNRFLLILVLTLPAIGLLERHGLREQAQAWIARMTRVTTARLLAGYLGLRQFTSMLGLTSLGGHAQTVRPLLAPMAEATATREHGELPEATRDRVKALCAATDNVGLFFGEDVFIAFGAVLLMQAFMAEHGIQLDPLAIALWGLPTAIAAFAIHATRLWRLDASLRREIAALRASGPANRGDASP
jgi:uncharacterized membrane protein